jgi:hypothetical protein
MKEKIRKGCKDIWNAFMVQNASFDQDIPYCQTTGEIPKDIITWEEAINLYRQESLKKHQNFSNDAYITFNIDDYKFDSGKYSIWKYPKRALKIIKHFAGIITPDYSTYIDMPEPIKYFNTYRMRAFGYWCNTCGVKVINNVRWDFTNNYQYCFCGIPKNSIVLIGTVASGLKKKSNRPLFDEGFFQMIKVLSPKVILVYGSANYPCFMKAKEMGIIVIQYQSKTNRNFHRGNLNG